MISFCCITVNVQKFYLYTKVFDKIRYANSVDPDQTASLGAVRVYTVCHTTKYFKKQLYKKQTLC